MPFRTIGCALCPSGPCALQLGRTSIDGLDVDVHQVAATEDCPLHRHMLSKALDASVYISPETLILLLTMGLPSVTNS